MGDMFRHVERKLGDTNAIWVFWLFQYGRQFNFQDDRHWLSWNAIFWLQMAGDGLKQDFVNKSYVLNMSKNQLMLSAQFQSSACSNMAANFQDGCHRLSYTSLP